MECDFYWWGPETIAHPWVHPCLYLLHAENQGLFNVCTIVCMDTFGTVMPWPWFITINKPVCPIHAFALTLDDDVMCYMVSSSRGRSVSPLVSYSVFKYWISGYFILILALSSFVLFIAHNHLDFFFLKGEEDKKGCCKDAGIQQAHVKTLP